jgi:outer membrane protein assembly factor BamB
MLMILAALTVAGQLPFHPFHPPAASAAEPWPLYRGDAAMRGLADVDLPGKPVMKWTFKAPAAIKSSPVIAHQTVFIGDEAGHLHALDLATGDIRWTFTAQGPVEAPPSVLDNQVYVSSVDANLYCLEAATGQVKWTYAAQDKLTAAANFVKLPDGRTIALVGSHDTMLHAVDIATGKAVWTYTTDNFINAAVAIDDQRTIFGGCDGLVHIVNTATGQQVRTVEIGAYMGAAAAIDHGVAYVGHYGNEFIAVDLEGGKVLWTYKDKNFPYFCSPAVTGDRVIFGGRDKQIHAVNRADGALVWKFATRAKVDSSPVVARSKVVVGSQDGRLYVLNLADGAEVWSYDIGEAISSTPAVGPGLIVVAGEDGSVIALAGEGAAAGASPPANKDGEGKPQPRE